MNIGLTDFWINRPHLGRCDNFTILSDKYVNLNSVIVGENRMLLYNGAVDKYQIKAVVIDNIFYVDFSATGIREHIEQQIWILKHTSQVEYTISFVSLWELFKLPTIEQLNEFAKIKEEVIVPTILSRPSQEEYDNSIEEMRLSTGLSEEDQVRNIHMSLAEYLGLMGRMTHTRLSARDAVRHATIVHNYHNPVVQEEPENEPTIEYIQARELLLEHSDVEIDELLPESDVSLQDYIEWLEEFIDMSIDDIEYYGTIVYNYHRSTEPEVIDHPF